MPDGGSGSTSCSGPRTHQPGMRGPVGRAGGGNGGARTGHTTRGQGAAAASSAAVPTVASLTSMPGVYGPRASEPRSAHNDTVAAESASGQLLLQPYQPQPAPAAPTEAVSLVDAGWGFHAVSATKALSESVTDFRVVGVLGAQGTGKSALISAMLYDMVPPRSAITAAATAAATAVVSPPLPVPAPQHASLVARSGSLQAVSTAPPARDLSHGTSRLELRVHPGDRTLLLDSPPLWSASWVSELASNPEPPLLRGAACTIGSGTSIMSRAIADARLCGLSSLPVEGAAELLGLQLGALMLAACHVVVLMVDAVDEPRLWEYLQVIDTVAHCIPDVGSAAAMAVAGAAAGVAGGMPGGGGFPAAGPSLDAHQSPSPRRVAELVVVLTGLYDNQITVRHLRPQAKLLRLALQSTRLLGAPRPGSGVAAGRAINVLQYLGDDEGDGDSAACDSLGPLTVVGSANGGGGAATAAVLGGSVAGGGKLHQTAVEGGDTEVGGDGDGCGRPTDHSREPGGATGAGQLLRRRRHQQQRMPEAGGCGVLNFWALPRGWQRQQGQQRDPVRAHHSAAAYTARPPPPPALLAPLRAALLGLPRRPLALTTPSAPGAVAATTAVASSATGSMPYTTAVHPQPHHNLSEREWLRGVERLWDVELPRCGPLERYYLARQRTAFAGGGGWPVGPR